MPTFAMPSIEHVITVGCQAVLIGGAVIITLRQGAKWCFKTAVRRIVNIHVEKRISNYKGSLIASFAEFTEREKAAVRYIFDRLGNEVETQADAIIYRASVVGAIAFSNTLLLSDKFTLAELRRAGGFVGLCLHAMYDIGGMENCSFYHRNKIDVSVVTPTGGLTFMAYEIVIFSNLVSKYQTALSILKLNPKGKKKSTISLG